MIVYNPDQLKLSAYNQKKNIYHFESELKLSHRKVTFRVITCTEQFYHKLKDFSTKCIIHGRVNKLNNEQIEIGYIDIFRTPSKKCFDKHTDAELYFEESTMWLIKWFTEFERKMKEKNNG